MPFIKFHKNSLGEKFSNTLNTNIKNLYSITDNYDILVDKVKQIVQKHMQRRCKTQHAPELLREISGISKTQSRRGTYIKIKRGA